MLQNERTYIAIDLKSYYASVECMERGLDPMQTNLVVADPSRTEKTICLAVSPALFWNACTFTSQSNISAGSSSVLAVGMRIRSAPSMASVRMLSG